MTFKIDLTKIKQIKRRIIINDLIIVIPATLIALITAYFTTKEKDLKVFTYVSLSFIPFLILKELFNVWYYKQIARAIKILITNTGIEWEFKSKIVRKVDWNDMEYEIKENRFIKIFDKNFPSGNRKRMQIPPEIENREAFINELQRHNTYVT